MFAQRQSYLIAWKGNVKICRVLVCDQNLILCISDISLTPKVIMGKFAYYLSSIYSVSIFFLNCPGTMNWDWFSCHEATQHQASRGQHLLTYCTNSISYLFTIILYLIHRMTTGIKSQMSCQPSVLSSGFLPRSCGNSKVSAVMML